MDIMAIRLFAYLKKRGITQKEASKELKVTQNTISNWRKGKPVDSSSAKKILEYIQRLEDIFSEDHKVDDPDLTRIIEAWPRLSSNQQKVILAALDAFDEMIATGKEARITAKKRNATPPRA